MDKYSIKYMENHCIDVFFACGQFPIHVLTSGSILPDALNDIVRNRTLQEEVERNENGGTSSEVTTNTAYIQALIDRHRSVIEKYREKAQFAGPNAEFPNPNPEQISSHFQYYASLGFYSYDCSEIKGDGTAVYRLMAWPNKTREVPFELPQFSPANFKTTQNTPPTPELFEM